MSRKFYVTPSKDMVDYMRSSMFEIVHADEVLINECGALIFLGEDGKVAVAYAPGTWVLFTETEADE